MLLIKNKQVNSKPATTAKLNLKNSKLIKNDSFLNVHVNNVNNVNNINNINNVKIYVSSMVSKF
jgi:ribosomal 30S subunit maturation factor RimM